MIKENINFLLSSPLSTVEPNVLETLRLMKKLPNALLEEVEEVLILRNSPILEHNIDTLHTIAFLCTPNVHKRKDGYILTLEKLEIILREEIRQAPH